MKVCDSGNFEKDLSVLASNDATQPFLLKISTYAIVEKDDRVSVAFQLRLKVSLGSTYSI